MGRDFDSNVSLLRAMRPDYDDRRVMYAGRYDPATSQPDPNVYNGLDEGFIWVRDQDSRVAVPALMSALTAMCFVGFGDRVKTGINEEGDREAIQPYIIRQNAGKLNQILYESKKALPTPPEALEGGIVRAPSTPSLKLYVGADASQGWAGGEIDVDVADEPANPNEFRWLVAYFTGVYGEAPTYAPTTAHVSATVDGFKTTYLTDAHDKALPNGAIRLWGVTYGEGQATINNTDSRFVHLRAMHNPEWLVTVVTTGGSDGDVPTYVASTDSFTLAAQTGGVGGTSALEPIRTKLTSNPSTGSTTLTPIDSTNMGFSQHSHTLAVGDLVELVFTGMAYLNATDYIFFDFEIDQPTSADIYLSAASSSGNGTLFFRPTSGLHHPVSITATFVATEIGAHKFRPVWRTNTGTLQLNNAVSVPFYFSTKLLGQ